MAQHPLESRPDRQESTPREQQLSGPRRKPALGYIAALLLGILLGGRFLPPYLAELRDTGEIAMLAGGLLGITIYALLF